MPKEKEFITIGKEAVLKACHDVYDMFEITEEDVENLPDEWLRASLRNLVTHFDTPNYKKNDEEEAFLLGLRSVLDDNNESIINIFHDLKRNIETLPAHWFDRGLIYQTFKAITCLPKFQPYSLNRYIRQDRLQLRKENQNLNAEVKRLKNQLKDVDDEAGDNKYVDADNRYRLCPSPPSSDEGEGVGPIATTTTAAVVDAAANAS